MRVILKRRATFSAAHNYFLKSFSQAENSQLFGKYASSEGHGHNYIVEVEVAGEIDERTGMVVNISDIDKALRSEVVSALDGKFLNREVQAFADTPPSLENIVEFVRARLAPAIHAKAHLTGVSVWETDTLWATWRERSQKTLDRNRSPLTLTRMYDFSASHRLHSPQLSDEENLEVFGKCNNPNGHGHNYEIEVSVTGSPDPQTGMLISLEELDKAVDETVLGPLDHKHLNLDVPEFESANPTSEMLAVVIWRRLASRLSIDGDPRLSKVLVRETARNSFEYSGD